MYEGSLTTFQRRLLALLGSVRPRWRLTGGGALAGFHAGHRETRDLDLFWPSMDGFDEIVADVERVLKDAGLRVERLQTARTFARRMVSDGDASCVVDLVSDPTVVVDPPLELRVDGVPVLVDSPQEILTNKLCTLLSRSELRDLIDARWLTEHGGDLDRAVRDAQDKDGGFSAAVLAWVLQGSNLDAMGRAAGVEPETLEDLRRWRGGLIKRLIAMSPP
jgi:hypothetical protein